MMIADYVPSFEPIGGLAGADACARGDRLARVLARWRRRWRTRSDGSASDVNGARPVAVSAQGLRKRYRLGELHNLRRTVGRAPAAAHGDASAGARGARRASTSRSIVARPSASSARTARASRPCSRSSPGRRSRPAVSWRSHGRVLPLLAVGAGFHPELTGRENVTLFAPRSAFRRRRSSSRMDAVAEFAELERHMDTPVKRFSSGMLSRLSFSIAMQFPADIYVFDEVLAVVDGEFQARCLDGDQAPPPRGAHGDLRQPQPRPGRRGLRAGHVAGCRARP